MFTQLKHQCYILGQVCGAVCERRMGTERQSSYYHNRRMQSTALEQLVSSYSSSTFIHLTVYTFLYILWHMTDEPKLGNVSGTKFYLNCNHHSVNHLRIM